MKEQKNKKIIFCLIVIITLILYYGIRRNEENNELIENVIKDNLSINKLLKGQIEDDIHLNNSKLLNIRITIDDIKKTIIKEEMEKKQIYDNNIRQYKIELWMIETFFLTIFLLIWGVLYFYGVKKENKKKYKTIKKKYMNENQDYYLAESEIQYLINKGEYENEYNKFDDE